MQTRFVLIAAAALMSSGAYAADAPKPPAQPAVHSSAETKKLLLASAEKVRTPVADRGAESEAAKKPRGRVSTCRCGSGEEPEPDEAE